MRMTIRSFTLTGAMASYISFCVYESDIAIVTHLQNSVICDFLSHYGADVINGRILRHYETYLLKISVSGLQEELATMSRIYIDGLDGHAKRC